MKTKSIELLENGAESNKTFDFVSLYKPASETNVKLIEIHKSDLKLNEKKNNSNRGNLPHKNKKKIKNSSTENSTIENANKSSATQSSNITCTPNDRQKKDTANVKPIIKNSEDSVKRSETKPKKRNKSVSFMLDDNEEVAVKKTKSNNSSNGNQHIVQSKNNKKEKKKLKKLTISNLAEKENEGATNIAELDKSDVIGKTKMLQKTKSTSEVVGENTDPAFSSIHYKRKANKKAKKLPKEKELDTEKNTEGENESAVPVNENKNQLISKCKKSKKKKHSLKPSQDIDCAEGEPVIKSRKKDVKSERIAEDLENLNIGDNTHTLTNLLDEMTVVDKKETEKKKKKTGKHPKTANPSITDNIEKSEEVKEKEKWMKRKWNKDKKGVLSNDQVIFSVIVENLPMKIMLSYKKLLTEHFSKCGAIKKIGIAEVYPTEDPKPVFTTTIYFDNEDASSKALEEDNTSFEGNFIRVKRPLPPTQTTLVVRSYGELSEQALSSVFSSAGRIRNIRHLVKGKKSMATAFIEFDGPKAVERATKMAEEAKIGGKKVHVSKFQMRRVIKNKKIKKNTEKENKEDSDDSTD